MGTLTPRTPLSTSTQETRPLLCELMELGTLFHWLALVTSGDMLWQGHVRVALDPRAGAEHGRQ